MPFHGKRQVEAASQVSPTKKNGVPSAYRSACPFSLECTKPRRFEFCAISASSQAIARNVPVPPLRPVSSVRFDPDRHVQSPGPVATKRILKVRPPSQKPYTRFLKPGPSSCTQQSTSVYGFAYSRAACKVISCVSHT